MEAAGGNSSSCVGRVGGSLAFFGNLPHQRLDIDGHQLVHSRVHLAAGGKRANIHSVPDAAVVLGNLLDMGTQALKGNLRALALSVFLAAEGTGLEDVVE